MTDRAKSTECSLFLQITKRESIPVEKMLSRSPNIHIRENSPQLYKIPPAKKPRPQTSIDKVPVRKSSADLSQAAL